MEYIIAVVVACVTFLFGCYEVAKKFAEIVNEIKKLRGREKKCFVWDPTNKKSVNGWYQLSEQEFELGPVQAQGRQAFSVYTGKNSCNSKFENTNQAIVFYAWDSALGTQKPEVPPTSK